MKLYKTNSLQRKPLVLILQTRNNILASSLMIQYFWVNLGKPKCEVLVEVCLHTEASLMVRKDKVCVLVHLAD